MFLARAMTVADPVLLAANETGNVAALMKAQLALLRQNNLLLQVPRLGTPELSAMASKAHAKNDWQTLGQVYTELAFRGPTDQTASVVKVQLENADIPDLSAARRLVAEAAQLKEFLGYTLRAIQHGEEDIGAQIERNSRPWQEQEPGTPQAA